MAYNLRRVAYAAIAALALGTYTTDMAYQSKKAEPPPIVEIAKPTQVETAKPAPTPPAKVRRTVELKYTVKSGDGLEKLVRGVYKDELDRKKFKTDRDHRRAVYDKTNSIANYNAKKQSVHKHFLADTLSFRDCEHHVSTDGELGDQIYPGAHHGSKDGGDVLYFPVTIEVDAQTQEPEVKEIDKVEKPAKMPCVSKKSPGQKSTATIQTVVKELYGDSSFSDGSSIGAAPSNVANLDDFLGRRYLNDAELYNVRRDISARYKTGERSARRLAQDYVGVRTSDVYRMLAQDKLSSGEPVPYRWNRKLAEATNELGTVERMVLDGREQDKTASQIVQEIKDATGFEMSRSTVYRMHKKLTEAERQVA